MICLQHTACLNTRVQALVAEKSSFCCWEPESNRLQGGYVWCHMLLLLMCLLCGRGLWVCEGIGWWSWYFWARVLTLLRRLMQAGQLSAISRGISSARSTWILVNHQWSTQKHRDRHMDRPTHTYAYTHTHAFTRTHTHARTHTQKSKDLCFLLHMNHLDHSGQYNHIITMMEKLHLHKQTLKGTDTHTSACKHSLTNTDTHTHAALVQPSHLISD